MSNDNTIEALVKQVLAALPEDLRLARADLQKNLKAIITAGLGKMDLVTREEFDVQMELLARTRAALEKLQKQLGELEDQISKKNAP